jgi:O-antigen ligase
LGIWGSDYPGTINYSGVSWGKNSLGKICLISGLFFFYNFVVMRRKNKTANFKENYLVQALFIIVILYLLSIINSATSSGALAIGILVFIMLGIQLVKNNIKYLGIFFVIALITGIILQMSFDMIGMFVESSGRELTLTGRTLLWKKLLAFRTNPLVGVGYDNFWVGKRLIMIGHAGGRSHNGYLNVYLELGMVGLFLLAGIIYFAYRNIHKALLHNFDYGRFRMTMLITVLLYNVTEANIGGMSLIWFVFFLIAIDIPQKSQLHYSVKDATKPAHLWRTTPANDLYSITSVDSHPKPSSMFTDTRMGVCNRS